MIAVECNLLLNTHVRDFYLARKKNQKTRQCQTQNMSVVIKTREMSGKT